MRLNKKAKTETAFWQGTMSDIAFLLIIFFILTALFSVPYILRFTAENSFPLLVERADLITVEIAENGNWLMNNNVIKKNSLAARLRKDKRYRLKVNDKRPYQEFIDILDILHKNHIHNLEIMTD